MKSTVETLSPTRVRLAVEVPFEEVEPSLKRAYKKIADQIRVPGFRPGKAPARIIDQRVGRGPVLEEVVQDTVPRAYADALQQTGTNVVGQPDIQVTKIEDNELIAFTAEVDVRPDFALPDLDTLSVQVDAAEVSDADVEEQLNQLRERFAVLSTVDRPVADGDFVSIDLTAAVDGEEVEDASSSGMSYQVGSGGLVDGLDEALVGLSAEESTTFSTTLLGEEHEGETADVAVTVRSVKEREMPEPDDEFAQTASEFDTIDALHADIATRLSRMKQAQQASQAQERLLASLLVRTEVPLPQALVDFESGWRRDNISQQLEQAEMTRADYLQAQGQTEEEFDTELQSTVQEAVKTQLVLDAIADARQTKVSDADITEHIMAEAQRYGVAPQALAQQVQASGNIGALMSDVRRTKTMRDLLLSAEITEPSGAAVDLTPVLGPAGDDESDPADAAVVDEVHQAEAPEPAATS